MIEPQIIDYLHDMGCAEINPVWDYIGREKVVGYHWECNKERILKEVRETLDNFFKMERLKYSLSEKSPDCPTTKLIIYLNN